MHGQELQSNLTTVTNCDYDFMNFCNFIPKPESGDTETDHDNINIVLPVDFGTMESDCGPSQSDWDSKDVEVHQVTWTDLQLPDHDVDEHSGVFEYCEQSLSGKWLPIHDQSASSEILIESSAEEEIPLETSQEAAPLSLNLSAVPSSDHPLLRRKGESDREWQASRRPLTRSSKSQDLSEWEPIKDQSAVSIGGRGIDEKKCVSAEKPIFRKNENDCGIKAATSSTLPNRKRQGAEIDHSFKCRKIAVHSSETIELLWKGEWWEAFQVGPSRADGCILVGYVGGESDEDEWICPDSARIRQSQDRARARKCERWERTSPSLCSSSQDQTAHDDKLRLQAAVPLFEPASDPSSDEEQTKCTGKQNSQKCKPSSRQSSMKSPKGSLTPGVPQEIVKKEEEMKRSFRSKGLDLRLNERVSVVNKKVDIHLKSPNSFSRTLLLQNLKNGRNNLGKHIVEVTTIKSNGQDEKRPNSAIFGNPVALHLMVQTINSDGSCQSPSKVVIRFYKENLGSSDSGKYLIQFNAGGHWTCDTSIAHLIVDIFKPFRINFEDVKVRTESSLYSVSNSNTFPGHRINIPLLITKLKEAGHKGAKFLGATGGVSLEFSKPIKCKPQVQVTGTIYVPFCFHPRRARLVVLELLLQFPETIQRA